MGYLKKSTHISGAWIICKKETSESGCKTDYIFGQEGIGSPHGHLVTFNDSVIYNRQIDNLTAFPSGSTFIIEKKN